MKTQNIEGIYNYCDRWCERCTFTSRCAVFEGEGGLAPEEQDITNKAFWDRIGQNFAKAQELLQKAAEEVGIDLNTVEPELEERLQRKERIRIESRHHPLAMLTLEYSKVGRDWLKTQPGMLERLENLKSELTLGVETEEGARRETAIIKDSLAVIQWYLVFIHIKLSRALMGRAMNLQRDENADDRRDYDGSAKIALIGIERSINAWTALFEILPEHEDHFLKLLSMLQKIRTMAIQEFPEAMTFLRPGFDSGE